MFRSRTLILFAAILLGLGLWQSGQSSSVFAARAQTTPGEVPPVTVQPPQPDGSIIHVVQRGDTLASIAYAYKVTVAEILKLNNMPEDAWVISVGQKLIIKLPDQPTVTATLAETVAPTIAATATVLPPTAQDTASAPIAASAAATVENPPTLDVTPTPQPTSAVPSPTLIPLGKAPSVCVTAFDDANRNHWQDTDEKILPGVALSLAQQGGQLASLTTTADGPSCFDEVQAGIYNLAAVPPQGYGLTTSGALELDLKPGMALALTIGVSQGYQPPTLGADSNLPSATPAVPGQATSVLDLAYSKSGLVLFGLAGITLIAGLSFLFRRPR